MPDIPALLTLTAQGLSWCAVLGALPGLLDCRRAVDAARRAARRRLLRQTELLVLVEARRRAEELQRAVGQGVDDSAELVQTVHRGIAAIPFGVLGAIPVTRDTSRLVRRIHDASADGVYGAIRHAARRLLGGSVATDTDTDPGRDPGPEDPDHRGRR